ncbi:MAG TPA: hypothetical protein VHW44_22540 [Pseudonocardiaceae bacterium]|nr:hypothetical protein [Pseudonocardiaceae bacterium]
MDEAEQQALAALCEELVNLRTECAHWPEEKAALLRMIENEATARRPIYDLLSRLLGGDPLTETDRSSRLTTGLVGASGGTAGEERFGCPDGACSRSVRPVPAGPVPRCNLTGVRLRRR